MELCHGCVDSRLIAAYFSELSWSSSEPSAPNPQNSRRFLHNVRSHVARECCSMEEESTRKIFPHWNSSVDRPTTLAHIIDVWWWYFPVTENSSHCFALHLDSTICSNTPTCSLWSQNWSSDDETQKQQSRGEVASWHGKMKKNFKLKSTNK